MVTRGSPLRPGDFISLEPSLEETFLAEYDKDAVAASQR